MKRQTLTLIIILFSIFSLSAQRYPQGQGTFRTSGGFSFSPVDDADEEFLSYKVTLTPSVGYFFTDEALIGLGINYSAILGRNLYDASIRLSPSAKYYFILSRQEFIIANFTYNFDLATELIDGEKTITNNTSISVGPGASYFFTRRIGIEGTLLYTYYMFPNSVNKNKFSYSMGFNLNMPSKKPKKTKDSF
ncbi:MAG: outer membrane beta-barrel protein [Chitinophagales bacterium]